MSIKRRAVHGRHAQFDCTVIKVILMVYVPHCSIVNGTWHLLQRKAIQSGFPIMSSTP